MKTALQILEECHADSEGDICRQYNTTDILSAMEEYAEQFKQKEDECSKCINLRQYTTGDDEYPARTNIQYCSKDHFENEPNNMCPTINCPDFNPKPTKP